MRVFLRFGVGVWSAALWLQAVCAEAQWVLQDSGSTASLRGIDAVSREVAWASGSGGTVLRTVDGGKHWVKCAVPEGGEKLDFRGVQAFDAKTAIVMSSGTGDLSRLYKTVDGCATWKLVFTNPDRDGFFDSMQARSPWHATILGDSVKSAVRILIWDPNISDEAETYGSTPKAREGEGSFAASNSVLESVTSPKVDPTWRYEMRWASQTPEQIFFTVVRSEDTATCEPCESEIQRNAWKKKKADAASGIFGFMFRDNVNGVMVGGDYEHPDGEAIAGFSTSGGYEWTGATTLPHGYRSAVAYDAQSKAWITVGPNGTDVSFDDGKNWKALRPGKEDAADADQRWNALSLPFVVGSKGRIGVLRDGAVEAVK